VLSAIGDISFVAFSDKDVVRHPLVRAIIDAYDRAGSKAQRSKYES
jgi:phosphate starvation-inducible protein PhoH